MGNDQDAAIAGRHGLSESAVQALRDALRRSGGGHAQWSHPDLGGMGQWSNGGMMQIGDMFNHDLKARIAAAIADLAGAPNGGENRPREASQAGVAPAAPSKMSGSAWWPADFGSPASSGAQNGMRYACFPDRKRLAIETNGKLRVYDTGHHRLTGFSQQQGAGQDLRFDGPDGAVSLDDLTPL